MYTSLLFSLTASTYLLLVAGAPWNLDSCSEYAELNDVAVENSTAYWRSNRISQELLQLTVKRYASYTERGMHVGFFGGKAYVLSR